MNVKTLVSVLTLGVAVITGPQACAPRAPGGDTSGDSAGNTQPDGGKKEACSVPQKIQIEPISQVEAAGLRYVVTAYLMDEDCEVIDNDQDVMKVTLVATDASGRRLPPAHNAHSTSSPYNTFVDLAVAVGFSIELVATSNMTAPQVVDNGVAFIACQILPIRGTHPTSVRLENVTSARGSKVTCSVKG